MMTILTSNYLFPALRYGQLLFLLIVLQGCTKNRDIPKPSRVTQIMFKQQEMSLGVGQAIELKVFHLPAEVKAPDYEWTVVDESVATVENGMVYGVKPGETEVAVRAKGLNLTARIKIRVLGPQAVESVSLNVQQTTVTIGEGIRLLARILPENTTDQRLVWYSDDQQVASVDQGIVLGLKEGTTMIRVSTVDGLKSASCQITVKPVQVQNILLSKADLSLVVGQDHLLEAIVLPEEAKDKSLKWNSSNTSVATVDQRGAVVAQGKGTAIIWAVSAVNPRVQAATQVLVLNPEDLVFIQVTATAKVTVNGYVSADLSCLVENGYSVPVQLNSFEVVSHSGEVVIGDYQSTVISPSIQHRHTTVIRNVYRPYIRYVFEINGRRYQRRVDI